MAGHNNVNEEEIQQQPEPDEKTRLLNTIKSNLTEEQLSPEDLHEYDEQLKYKSDCVKCGNWIIFYLCCIVTGEYVYIPSSEFEELPVGFPVTSNYKQLARQTCKYLVYLFLRFLTIGFCLMNITQVITAVGFDFFAVITCNFSQYCGFIYDLNVSTELLMNASASNKDQLLHVFNWNKAVVITASIAGALSYIFMVWALYGRYTCLSSHKNCVCCYQGTDLVSCCVNDSCCACLRCEPAQHSAWRELDKPNVLVVNPFKDDDYSIKSELANDQTPTQYVSSLLTPKQYIYFNIVFLFSVLVYLASVILYAHIIYHVLDNKTYHFEWLELTGFIAQFFSQFCSLVSCFIFSKVAYAVSNRCLDYGRYVFLLTNFNNQLQGNTLETIRAVLGLDVNINDRQKEVHRNRLAILKAMDQKYVQLLRNSLYPFGAWFAIHWILHTLTAFMSIAYVADEVTMRLYGPADCDWGSPYCNLKLFHSIFFALFHCILFLYPCFRAASVTRARRGMIKSVSKARWVNVEEQTKEVFTTYLKDQDASFKIDILCARLTFGFELAFLLIVVGVFGVVMKLALS